MTYVNRKARLTAAIVCVVYIIIQVFQDYVVRTIPAPNNLTEELLQGDLPMNICLSLLLLLIFFPMIYVYLVIILHDFKKNALLNALAFIGLLIFCFLEITIRSVEFFYVQLQMPKAFQLANSEDIKNSILNIFSIFQSIQNALYFPLLLAQTISSVLIYFIFSPKPKLNLFVKIAFGLNAIRLVGRLALTIFHVSWFARFIRNLYLPFVLIIFGLMTIWLLKVKDKPDVN